jgi:uncharacterized delta-60 repeat protein
MRIFVCIVFVCTLVYTSLWAKAGEFDSSFGDDGKVTTTFFGTDDYERDSAMLSDGSIVQIGLINEGDSSIVLVRYNSDGRVIYIKKTEKGNGYRKQVAVDSNDNIIVTQSHDTGMGFYRFDSNGDYNSDNNPSTFDSAFITFDSDSDEGAIAIDSQDRIVLATVADENNVTVIRFKADATIDTAFGTNGIVMTDLGTNVHVGGISIQDDGKIVVAGSLGTWGNSKQAYVLRYNSNGTPDTSFDSDGKMTHTFSDDVYMSDMIIHNNQILCYGGYGNDDAFVMRLNSNGALDNNFGTNAEVIIHKANAELQTNDIGVDNNNKIILTGSTHTSSKSELLLIRLNSNGSYDTSFSGDGQVSGNFKGYSGERTFIVGSDILVSGYYSIALNFHDFALMRYLNNGNIDTTFANNGSVLTDLDSRSADVRNLARTDGNKIVAVGSVNNGIFDDFALIQYQSDGSVDESFGTYGRVHTDIGADDDIAYSVAIDKNAKIVLAGVAYDATNSDIALVRYETNGTLDSSFNSNGKVLTDFGGDHNGAFGVAVDSLNRIVVAGYYTDSGSVSIALARYDNTGNLDTNFGSAGKIEFNSMTIEDAAMDIVIDVNNNIFIAGYINSNNINDYDFLLMRFNTTGGIVYNTNNTKFSSGRDKANALALTKDGKIVLVGSAEMTLNHSDFAIARYKNDGTLDTTFSSDGKTTLHFTDHDSYARGVDIAPNGKIIVTGYLENQHTLKYDFAVVRYNTDGSLDESFANGGVLISDFESVNAKARAVSISKNGKITITGTSDKKFGLAQIIGDSVPLNAVYFLLF